MKRIVLFITIMFVAIFAQAQVNDVTLLVNGEGTTKNEATTLALRSAIEQAFGTFVSANTEILNDEIVKDEIATVASGNIKSYKEISSVKTDDGYNVTLEAVVSIGKLIEYSKSHGSSAEFAGKTFAMQMKLEQLNIDNEKRALHDMIRQLYLLLPDVFDYSIEVGTPVMTSTEECTLDCVVSLNTNANSKSFYDIINKYFQGLSIDKNLNTPNKYRVLFDGKEYYLRTNEWMLDMNCLLNWGLFPKILDFRVLGKTGENKQMEFYSCWFHDDPDNISRIREGEYLREFSYGWFEFSHLEFLNKIDGIKVDDLDHDNLKKFRIGEHHVANWGENSSWEFRREKTNIVPTICYSQGHSQEETNIVPTICYTRNKSIIVFPFANPYNNKTIYHVELQLKLKNTILENLEEIVVQSYHDLQVIKHPLINEDNISDPTPLPNKSKVLTDKVLLKLFKTKYEAEFRRSVPYEGFIKYKNCSFPISLTVYGDGHLSTTKYQQNSVGAKYNWTSEYLTSQNTNDIYLWYHKGDGSERRQKIDDVNGQMKSWMQFVLKRFEDFISTIRVTPPEINGVVKDNYPFFGDLYPFDFGSY